MSPISVSFEYKITDRQDKLIMFKRSLEVREFVLSVNFRGLFFFSCFVSADGKELFLQDRAVKFNDFLGNGANWNM